MYLYYIVLLKHYAGVATWTLTWSISNHWPLNLQ